MLAVIKVRHRKIPVKKSDITVRIKLAIYILLEVKED